jgi:hypothetical protein
MASMAAVELEFSESEVAAFVDGIARYEFDPNMSPMGTQPQGATVQGSSGGTARMPSTGKPTALLLQST